MDEGFHGYDSARFEPPPVGTAGKRPPEPVRPFDVVKGSAFVGPAPLREWYLEDVIPHRNVTQLSGDGGVGKGLVVLQVCIAGAVGGSSPIGTPRQGPSLIVTTEEEKGEMHRRVADITRASGIDRAELGDLNIISLAGDMDTALAVPAPPGSPRAMIPTPQFARLEATVAAVRPVVLVIDTQADSFGGNENDRAQVRAFLGMLRGLAFKYDLTIILVSHPSQSGLRNGSGSSGVTGWSNSVRSRLYLARIFEAGKGEEPVEPDPLARKLTVMKNNYGPKGAVFHLRWANGRFVRAFGDAETDRGAAVTSEQVDDLFLALLEEYNRQSRRVSASPGANFAPAVMAKDPAAHGVSKREFHRALERLLRADRVHIERTGPASKVRESLVLGPPSEAANDLGSLL